MTPRYLHEAERSRTQPSPRPLLRSIPGAPARILPGCPASRPSQQARATPPSPVWAAQAWKPPYSVRHPWQRRHRPPSVDPDAGPSRTESSRSPNDNDCRMAGSKLVRTRGRPDFHDTFEPILGGHCTGTSCDLLATNRQSPLCTTVYFLWLTVLRMPTSGLSGDQRTLQQCGS